MFKKANNDNRPFSSGVFFGSLGGSKLIYTKVIIDFAPWGFRQICSRRDKLSLYRRLCSLMCLFLMKNLQGVAKNDL